MLDALSNLKKMEKYFKRVMGIRVILKDNLAREACKSIRFAKVPWKLWVVLQLIRFKQAIALSLIR